ncbi:MAG: MFS transporter [Ktedonobacteraceae bacterium]
MLSHNTLQTTEETGSKQLGLRPNLIQFSLLATITFGVGLVVGAERVVVPVLARNDFAVATYLATLAFIVSFGFVKAALNLVAGRLADQYGRKSLLIIGWLIALPIPFLIIFAPSWNWIVAANLLLGVNQGLAWTMTVTSKIDLVGPRSRGFALGINEFSGYAGVSVGGFVGGWLGGIYGLRVAPFLFVLGVIVVMTCTTFLVRETLPYTHLEQQERAASSLSEHQDANGIPLRPSLGRIVALTTWGDRALAAASQAGLIEKFTDTLAWGLFPLYFASRGLAPVTIGAVVAAYTGTWAILQIYTGHLSDRLGRKWLIAGGMWLSAAGIVLVAISWSLLWWLSGAVLMGLGMALLYPTLLAAVSDVAAPRWRATSLGVYRLWRDSGYAFGALTIGLVADAFGLLAGFWFAAGIMSLSGLLVAVFMYETLPTRRTIHPAWEREARWQE